MDEGQFWRERYAVVINEINRYSKVLANKPCWVVMNKIDLVDQTVVALFEEKLRREGCKLPIFSSALLQGRLKSSWKILLNGLMKSLREMMIKEVFAKERKSWEITTMGHKDWRL